MRKLEKRIIALEAVRAPPPEFPSIDLMTDAEIEALLASNAIEDMSEQQCLWLLGGEPTEKEMADALA